MIAIGWFSGGSALYYHNAVNNVYRTAIDSTKLLRSFHYAKSLDLLKIHLIGHSLGAHVCGMIGRHFGGTISRITGKKINFLLQVKKAPNWK